MEQWLRVGHLLNAADMSRLAFVDYLKSQVGKEGAARIGFDLQGVHCGHGSHHIEPVLHRVVPKALELASEEMRERQKVLGMVQ